MVSSKMLFQGIVVLIVLLLSSFVPPITNVTSFMFISTMCVELVITIEPLHTKSTLGMPLESTLIYGTRIVVAKLLMFPKLLRGEQLMFMGEDLLVPRT